MSDEFDGTILDTNKWHLQGARFSPTDSSSFYYSNFRGRAPGAFSPRNVRFNDGKLIINTRAIPQANFDEQFAAGGSVSLGLKGQMDRNGNTYGFDSNGNELPITSAAVVSKQTLQYGYMEIMAKPADNMTKPADNMTSSAFWMTGSGTELDVYEFTPNPSGTSQDDTFDSELWSSIHDWSAAGGGRSTWTNRTNPRDGRADIGFDVANDVNIYGVDWQEDYLLFHVNGQPFQAVLREGGNGYSGIAAFDPARVYTISDAAWTIDVPLRIWMDSEVFPFIDVPTAPYSADYQIEYIRTFVAVAIPEPSGSLLLTCLSLLSTCSRRRPA